MKSSTANMVLAGVGLAAITSAIAGCASLNVDTWSFSKAEKPQPGRMMIRWVQATRVQTAKRQMRGFEGQIAFFAKGKIRGDGSDSGRPSEHPIKVDGALTVYAFDETAGGKGGAGPPRKFVFAAEKFKKFLHPSTFGPSYTVWLPWDAAGGPPQEVRLLARFDAADGGPVVMSETSHHRLPGSPDTSQIASRPSDGKGDGKVPETKTARGTVTQAGFETSAQANAPASSERTAQRPEADRTETDGPR